MSKRELRIVVEITRNYGAHSIKFGMGEVVKVANGSERREAFNNLLSQLDDQINIYEDVHLQHVTLPQGQSLRNDDLNKLEKFTITAINVEFKNGKKYISAQGGKYTKFGVAIYPDSCITDLPIEDYELGLHDMTVHNLTATIDLVDGKAQRVVSIQ